MRTTAPAALPIFRSEEQMRLLGVLFDHRGVELTVTALATAAHVAVATASREVGRLQEHGLVTTRTFGRMRLVAANWDLPWAAELASILAQTVGVPAMLADALEQVPGVHMAYIFGSWAARSAGEIGPPPQDIDLLVVGDAKLGAVRAALEATEGEVGVEINAVIVSELDWRDSDDPFLVEVRSRPTEPLNLKESRG